MYLLLTKKLIGALGLCALVGAVGSDGLHGTSFPSQLPLLEGTRLATLHYAAEEEGADLTVVATELERKLARASLTRNTSVSISGARVRVEVWGRGADTVDDVKAVLGARRLTVARLEGESDHLAELPTELMVESAKGAERRGGVWGVEVRLTPQSAIRFEELTARSVHQRVALMLDGEVLASPTVTGAISGDRVLITMSTLATERDADQLAMRIAAAGGPAIVLDAEPADSR